MLMVWIACAYRRKDPDFSLQLFEELMRRNKKGEGERKVEGRKEGKISPSSMLKNIVILNSSLLILSLFVRSSLFSFSALSQWVDQMEGMGVKIRRDVGVSILSAVQRADNVELLRFWERKLRVSVFLILF